MFDPKSVVLQVKQGNYPSNWHVFQGKGNYVSAIIFWIGAASCILLEVSSSSAGWNTPLPIILLFSAIACIFLALIWKRAADSNAHSFMVILPLGIVEYDDNYPDDVAWLYFPDIYRIELAQRMDIIGFDGDVSSSTHYWLDVFGISGTYIKWTLENDFGDAASIGNTIIAAWKYYWHHNISSYLRG